MTEHAAAKPKTDDPEHTPKDAAVAVSLRDLRALVAAAAKHASKDEHLAGVLAPFTDL